jgi:predicted TIM-barrel fold metal-dependent hydrolase
MSAKRQDDVEGASGRLAKRFPVFDCDAHVNDPVEIWTRYVDPADRELVKQTYWRDDQHAILNGRTSVVGGSNADFAPLYNPICLAGPQMNKKIIRRLMSMVPLSPEQRDYVEHKGAKDPLARLREMDLMGIDQVMVIPTMVVMHFPFAENVFGARAFARGYNDWALDYCKAAPDRLYAAAWLPLQNTRFAVEEIHRAAKLGFRMGLVRPIDALGRYPNQIFGAAGGPGPFDAIYRAFEETGMVLGVHTFPAPEEGSALAGGGYPRVVSPGQLITRTGEGTGIPQRVDSQTMSFIFEAMAWLGQILFSGFLDRYPKLKMAILESNSTWLPATLERCDRLFKLYARERRVPARRLPSEAFREQCFIAFESDEVPVFRQWQDFEDIGIWSSDAYHHDGADSWSAMREMIRVGVPEAVQAKLLGGNARRLYGIEPRTFVDEEPPPIRRPDWFPGGPELDAWAELQSDPRKHRLEMATHGGLAGSAH